MDANEIWKRLQLVDERAELMWKKYPVYTVVVAAVPWLVGVAIGFILGKVL